MKCAVSIGVHETYSNLHALTSDKFHAAHDVLLHLDELGEFLGEVGTESTGRSFSEGMAC